MSEIVITVVISLITALVTYITTLNSSRSARENNDVDASVDMTKIYADSNTDMINQLKELSDRNLQLADDFIHMQEELSGVKQELQAVQSQLDNQSQMYETLKTENADWQQRYDSLQDKYQRSVGEIATLKNYITSEGLGLPKGLDYG